MLCSSHSVTGHSARPIEHRGEATPGRILALSGVGEPHTADSLAEGRCPGDHHAQISRVSKRHADYFPSTRRGCGHVYLHRKQRRLNTSGEEDTAHLKR